MKEKVKELVQEIGITLKNPEWDYSVKNKGFDRAKWSLKITTTGSKAVKVSFGSNELQDCLGKSQASQEIKAKLERRLSENIKSLLPLEQEK